MIDRLEGVDLDALREGVPLRRIANVLGLVLLVVIVVPFVVYSVPQVVGAEHSYVVLSGSMSPTIHAGDVVIVDSVDASAIEEGDVITYRRSGDVRPTTHRVIDVVERDGERHFQTKGDGNPAPDRELVAPGDIEGRVMSLGGVLVAIPLIGHVIMYAGTTVGFLALFVLPVAALVVLEIRDVVAAASGEESDQSAAGTGPDAGARPATETKGSGRPAPENDGAVGSSDGVEGANEPGVSFRANELRLGIVVTVAFLGYSLWVAYATREIWAFAVAGSVGSAFVLLAGLYTIGGSSPSESADDDGGPDEPDADAHRWAHEARGGQDSQSPTPFEEEDEAILLGSLFDPPGVGAENPPSSSGSTPTARVLDDGEDDRTEPDVETPVPGAGTDSGGDGDE